MLTLEKDRWATTKISVVSIEYQQWEDGFTEFIAKKCPVCGEVYLLETELQDNVIEWIHEMNDDGTGKICGNCQLLQVYP